MAGLWWGAPSFPVYIRPADHAADTHTPSSGQGERERKAGGTGGAGGPFLVVEGKCDLVSWFWLPNFPVYSTLAKHKYNIYIYIYLTSDTETPPANNDRLLAAVLAWTGLCRRHEASFRSL